MTVPNPTADESARPKLEIVHENDPASERVAYPEDDDGAEPTLIRKPAGVDRSFVAKPEDVLSESQMWAVLNDGRAALSAAEAKLAAAQSVYKSKTYRVHYETEAAWKASFAEYEEPVKAAEDAVLAAADALAKSAVKVNQQVATNDRSNVTSDELAAANLIREYVREDCAERGLTILAADIAKALISNDRARLFLFQRYAKKRLDAPTAADKGRPEAAAQVRVQLNQVDRLFADTSLNRYADQAKAAIQHVVNAEQKAKVRQKEADKLKPIFDRDGRELVRWPER